MSTKKAVFIFFLVAIIVSAIFYLISRTTHSGDFIKEVELNGDTVKISGYTMPENLRLNLVYEPREDLNSYGLTPIFKPRTVHS